jgi:hypothetical protein
MFWELSLSIHTKIEHCIKIRDADHFVFRSARSGPPSMKPSSQRLVVGRRPSGPPLTASRFRVEVFFLKWSLPSVYNLRSKKNWFFTEPSKKVPEMSKSVQRCTKSQKKDKKIYETFKGSYRVSRWRTFSYETCFKVRYSRKRFRIKLYEIMRV